MTCPESVHDTVIGLVYQRRVRAPQNIVYFVQNEIVGGSR